MGGLLAESLADQGATVTLVTPAPLVSRWTENTLEQARIQTRLLEKGVKIIANHDLASADERVLKIACVFTGKIRELEADALVLVTARDPRDALLSDLRGDDRAANGLRSLVAIGDCLAPGTVAAAIYLGHLAARNLEGEPWDAGLFNRR